jgi:competence protein ComEA
VSATEQDAATAPPAGDRSRAAEVLERLVAERTAGAGPRRLRRPGPLRRSWTSTITAVAVGLVAVALIAGLVVWRRPAPIDERLPITTGPASTAPDASSTPGSSTTPDSSTTAPAGPLIVHVAGAVVSPGVVRLSAGSRVVDAVRAAGGLRPDADADRVNLAAPVADGQRVVVPAVGQEVPAEVVPSGPPGPGGRGGPSGSGRPDSPGAPAGRIDLNSATVEQLDTLPGVGPATAAAILAHRDESGPFQSVEDLLEVRGIGEAKLEAMRDLVTVAP